MDKYKVLKYTSTIDLEKEINKLAREGYVVDKAFYSPTGTGIVCVCVIMRLDDTPVCEPDIDYGCRVDQYTY